MQSAAMSITAIDVDGRLRLPMIASTIIFEGSMKYLDQKRGLLSQMDECREDSNKSGSWTELAKAANGRGSTCARGIGYIVEDQR